MNLSDKQTEELEAESSAPSTVLRATVLSLLLGTFSYPPEAVLGEDFQLGTREVVITSNAMESSNESISCQRSRYAEIMQAMGKAYDHLLASQKELDEIGARVLYDDLWSLYE